MMFPRFPRGRVPCLIPFTLIALAACGQAPVQWSEAQSVSGPPPPLPNSSAGAFALSPDGRVVDDSLLQLAARLSPPSAACPGSLRVSRAAGTLHAVWWAPRPDSGARLLAASSRDGGATWGAIAPVDTTDRSVTGCRRAPPAIAADSSSGYIHIAYGLHAPEGPGLFFSHSMDHGASFHSPVPILYGERMGRTSVAAQGDFVAVAFEDPNSSTRRVGLALSRTMGHIFEDRLMPVSDDNGAATHPLVSVQGRRITVAWGEHAASGGDVLRVRTGQLQTRRPLRP